MNKPMREQMPEVSAFVDSLREAFGKELIDGQIRRGMKGEPVFYATENGAQLGTPLRQDGVFVSVDPLTGMSVATRQAP